MNKVALKIFICAFQNLMPDMPKLAIRIFCFSKYDHNGEHIRLLTKPFLITLKILKVYTYLLFYFSYTSVLLQFNF